ncbi:trypsin-like serine protease [Xanthomonas sp. XNM01]|uniref:S1 family peptidase n=1 Tax=Xanthomonas sp. XNM01 TaxID=2769289 RepID=UPI00177EF6DA|nr:trypsin-like serine protease [Xanthomonas sp. XNM01]MBD9370681.1 trypsin-like serine protease [Xanthomonas sp. XNM01]
MIRHLLLLLLAASSSAGAVVIRDDVDDARYRIDASAFPALVDMPGEGHGVLIAPQWVVTAAHTVPPHAALAQVTVGGVSREVERVVFHPGYRRLPQTLIDQALQSGEAILLLVDLASSDDIALLRLKAPVTDVVPVPLYRGEEEAGRVVQLIGKGATGTGADGHDPRGPNRTTLRRAFNTITSAHERWFCHVFDAPPSALPLEGVTGNGDSGGPALIEVDGQWQLAGLSAWKVVQGDVRTARPGRYGQTSCNVRLRHYADWIETEMTRPEWAGQADRGARRPVGRAGGV